MYSRNFGTFETVNPAKLNSSQGNSHLSRKNNDIPIKTYPDNSAYERFNNLGNEKHDAITKEEINNNIKTEHQTTLTETETTSESEHMSGNINVVDDIEQAEISDKKTKSLLGELQKLTSIIDGDYFLIILAIAMLFISGTDTNDKITPIALLAIMFL